MKSLNIARIVGAGTLITSLSILPSTLRASAQSFNSGTASGETTQQTTTSTTTKTSPTTSPNTSAVNTTSSQNNEHPAEDRGFDWGWLGLLGLIGLAGLSPQRREVLSTDHNETNSIGTTEGSVHYHEPNTTNRPTTTEPARYHEPNETNIFSTTEEAARYRDPNENLPDNNGSRNKY